MLDQETDKMKERRKENIEREKENRSENKDSKKQEDRMIEYWKISRTWRKGRNTNKRNNMKTRTT